MHVFYLVAYNISEGENCQCNINIIRGWILKTMSDVSIRIAELFFHTLFAKTDFSRQRLDSSQSTVRSSKFKL